MNKWTRVAAGAASIACLAMMGAALPAAAATTDAVAPAQVPGLPSLPVPCTYSFDQATYTISGNCDFTVATGSFTGKVDPTTMSASGSFAYTSPLGSASGTFTGSGQPGSPISGTFVMTPPSGLPSLPSLPSLPGLPSLPFTALPS